MTTLDSQPDMHESQAHRTRALYIGYGSPWRCDAGHMIRQWMLMQGLNACAQVTAVLFGPDEEPSPRDNIQLIRLPLPTREQPTRFQRATDDLFDPRPRMLRGYDIDSTRQRIAQLSPGDFDLVLSYRIDFGYFAGVLQLPNLVLDIDDPEHLRQARSNEVRYGDTLDRWTKRDLAKLRRFERKAASRAAVSLVCQPGDRDAFAEPKPVVVPNTVLLTQDNTRNEADPPVAVFLGDCSGGKDAPNVDGILWFVREVWPKVIAQHPAALLEIWGRASEQFTDTFADAPGVSVKGYVPDPTALLNRAAVSLAPIRYGTGTRIKILTSMALGCPVLSTTMGCDGIACTPDRDLLVSDEAEHMAGDCVRLLTDPSLRKRLADAGRDVVAEHYDMMAQVPRLTALFTEQIQRAQQGNPHG